MDRQVRDAWVSRLRSGTVKQTASKLGRLDGSRCCLGVLCDLAVEDGAIQPPTPDQRGNLWYGDWAEYLPGLVCMWAGMTACGRCVVVLNSDGLTDSLTAMNDRGVPFDELADIIEKQL
jgi:hypothetical protein